MGWIAFALLNLLALLAAAALATRARLAGRVETATATVLLWSLVVLVPIHALGLAGRLAALPLGLASAAFSLAITAASGWGDLRARTLEAAASLWATLRLPWDAARATASAGSLGFVGVVAAAALLAWSLWQAWLFPSDGWDAIWYHETMVGHALQTRGFGPMSLPNDLTQQANGYPRSCEMMSLWFVVFTDRRLIEAVNLVMAVPMVGATYCVARRFLVDRAAAAGWATALLFLPAVALQLRTTYIDVHVAALLIASIHFVTRPRLRPGDAWLAAAALALLIGSKSMALAWVPPLALVAAVRLASGHARRAPLAVAAATLGGGALIAAFGALTYLRNWVLFRNPIYPVAWQNAKLGIRWAGVQALASTDVNHPLENVYRAMTAVPVPGRDYADTRVFGYGFGAPIVLLPVAAVALAFAVIAGAGALRRLVKREATEEDARTGHFLLLAALLLFMAKVSPALWAARYNVELVAGVYWAAAWLSGRLAKPGAVGDGLAGFAVLSNLASCLWLEPPIGGAGFAATLGAARRPAAERVAMAPAGWTMLGEVALARERELGPGTVVVWSDDMSFPAILWNERYDNRVEYLPARLGPAALKKRIDELGAKWLVSRERGPLWGIAQNGEWEEVGPACNQTTAWRRRFSGTPARERH